MNDCARSLRQDWTQSRLYNSSRSTRRLRRDAVRPGDKKTTRYDLLHRGGSPSRGIHFAASGEKQYYSYSSNVTLRGLSLPHIYHVPARIADHARPLSLQYGRNACQHRLAGYFLSRGHRAIDVTYNAAKADTKRGLLSWPRTARFSMQRHTYETIESSHPLSLPFSFCAFSIGTPESGMKRQRRGKREGR